MCGLISQSGTYLSGFMCLLRPNFGCAAYGVNQVVLCCGLKPTSICIGSSIPWEHLPCRPRSIAACDQSGATWQELQNYLLFVACAGPEMCKRGHTTNQGQVPSVLGLGQLTKRPRGLQGLRPPSSCFKVQPLKEPWAVHKLDEVGSQVLTRVGGMVLTSLVQIQVWHQGSAWCFFQKSQITPRPTTTCLGPTDPQDVSKKGCSSGWDQLPTTQNVSGGTHELRSADC